MRRLRLFFIVVVVLSWKSFEDDPFKKVGVVVKNCKIFREESVSTVKTCPCFLISHLTETQELTLFLLS